MPIVLPTRRWTRLPASKPQPPHPPRRPKRRRSLRSPALRDGSPPPASRHECCCYVTDRQRCRSIAGTPDAGIRSSRNWAARRLPGQPDASGTEAVSTRSFAHPSAEPVRRQRHRPACSVYPSSSTRVLIETDFGDWDGLTFREAAERDPDLHREWLSDTSVRPPGGESFDEVRERVVAARDDLISTYGGATLLVVSHVTPDQDFGAAGPRCRAVVAVPVASGSGVAEYHRVLSRRGSLGPVGQRHVTPSLKEPRRLISL